MAVNYSAPEWAQARLLQALKYWESRGFRIDHYEWTGRGDWSFRIYLFL